MDRLLCLLRPAITALAAGEYVHSEGFRRAAYRHTVNGACAEVFRS